MIRVAVITRTKDRPIFLYRAIASVATQTFTDYVHVIVNDGGNKDEVEAIIQNQKESVKKKIVVFHRSKPSGAPDTIFNESIDRVDSEYIAIHDDDDTWHKDFLLHTTTYLDANKEQAGVVVRTDKVIETISGHTIKTRKVEPWLPDLEVISLYRQCIDNQLTPIAFLFRRSAYVKVGKFDDTLPVVGDWEFGLRLLQTYEVGFINPGFALAQYHHRDNVKDNSFVAHSHRKYVTLVANRYLRQDIANSTLGIGYIISDLKYRQDSRNEFIKKLIPRGVLRVIKK